MMLNDTLQRLVDSGDWLGVVYYYLALLPLPEQRPSVNSDVLIFVGVCLLLVLQVRRLARRRARIPWRLGSQTVDLIGGQDTIHAGLGGTSGKGKSSALLPLLKLDIPVAAFGFDMSKPLEEWWDAHAGDERYIRWRMDGSLGWDILHGQALYAAEGLTAGFERSENDTGYQRGLARNRLIRLIEDDDQAGRSRDIWRYVDLMRQGGQDGEQNRACRRWAGSFETLLTTLGPALGNDFNMTDAMREGKRVLVMPNRFMLPETADLVGGIALVQVRRAAAEVGNFLVFIEEAGQARAYDKDISSLFQAGRTRGCPMVLITQNLSKLKEQVTNNISVWVVFGQRTDHEAKAAAMFTRVDEEEFFGMPRGTCWIRVEEQRAVKVKLPLIKPPRRRNLPVLFPSNQVPTASSYEPRALPGPRVIVQEVPGWVAGYEVRQRCFEKMRRLSEPALLWTPERGFWNSKPCLVWDGAARGRKRDRPAFKGEDGSTKTTYIEVYKWAGGTIPESWEIDHLCAVTLCCEPEHLEPVTTAENIKRRDGRVRALNRETRTA